MIKRLLYSFFIFLTISQISYATDLYCSFTEKNADYNAILGKGIINYNDVLFSIDDKTKSITHSHKKTPLEVLLYTKEILKFKMYINTENSENDYIITISRITGAIKTEHHRKLQIKTYSPLNEYLKNAPKYETHTIETAFYGNGTCSVKVKSVTPKF